MSPWYARLDVRYLLHIHDRLVVELRASKPRQWQQKLAQANRRSQAATLSTYSQVLIFSLELLLSEPPYVSPAATSPPTSSLWLCCNAGHTTPAGLGQGMSETPTGYPLFLPPLSATSLSATQGFRPIGNDGRPWVGLLCRRVPDGWASSMLPSGTNREKGR